MTLEQKIRRFQASRGLSVDGIMGSMTLIQMNTLTCARCPKLFEEV
jgi:murein L,D-transpeptidase YcbB/YkuD